MSSIFKALKKGGEAFVTAAGVVGLVFSVVAAFVVLPVMIPLCVAGFIGLLAGLWGVRSSWRQQQAQERRMELNEEKASEGAREIKQELKDIKVELHHRNQPVECKKDLRKQYKATEHMLFHSPRATRRAPLEAANSDTFSSPIRLVSSR
jgi:hypothetical protein